LYVSPNVTGVGDKRKVKKEGSESSVESPHQEDTPKLEAYDSNPPKDQQPPQQPQAQKSGGFGLLDRLEWQESHQSILNDDDSSDDDATPRANTSTNNVLDDEFARFSVQRTSGRTAPTRPAPASTTSGARHDEFNASDGQRNPPPTADIFEADFGAADWSGGAASATTVQTDDLLGGGGWATMDSGGGAVDSNLLDVGEPEQSNFDLLSGGGGGGGKGSFAGLPTSSNQDLFGVGGSGGSSDEELQHVGYNPFLDSPTGKGGGATVGGETKTTEILFDLFTTAPTASPTSMGSKPASASFLGDEFNLIPTPASIPKPKSSDNVAGGYPGTAHSTTPVHGKAAKETSPEDEFFAFMESSQPSGGRGGATKEADLLGDWTTGNLSSGVNVNMPRPISGTNVPGLANMPRNGSSQSIGGGGGVRMTSGAPPGSTRTASKDPFADIGIVSLVMLRSIILIYWIQ